MPTVYEDIEVRDKGSAILDQLTKRLGLMHTAGIKVGIGFAAMNAGFNLAQQALNGLISYMQEGVELNRRYDLSLTRLSVTTKNFDINITSLSNTLKGFSVVFAEDLSTLTTGVRNFIREGFTATESVKLLANAERLRVIVGEDLVDVQEAINTAMDVFNLRAEDAGFVTKKLYEIYMTTGLSMSEMNRIMGGTATELQNAGLGISGLANYLYTLDERGVSVRAMLSDLRDILKDPAFQSKILPSDKIPAPAAAFEKITATSQMRKEQLENLRELTQMDIAGGADVGSYFDKQVWAEATRQVDLFARVGVDSVEEFKAAFAYSGQGSLDTELNRLIMAIIETNSELNGSSDSVVTLESHLASLADAISTNEKNISSWNETLADYAQDKERTKTEYGYTIALHKATEAVQAQEDAIEKLRRKSNIYSLEQQENSLDIMRIEYAAGGRRLRRNDRERIEAIERENLRLRILETEQQVAIGGIQQNGLQTAQDDLDAVRRQHDQVMYDQELEDLGKHLDDVYKLYSDLYKQLERERAAYHANTLAYNQTTAANTPSFSGNRGGVWRGGRQFGGPIMATGLYTLHQGEYVVPRSGNTSTAPTKTQVNINIDLTIKNQDNAEHLAMKIGQLIAQGYLKGVDCVYHLGG